MKNKLTSYLFKPINPYTLSLFRVFFGFFALLEILYFYKTHLIEDYILQPKFLFNYDFLPLEPLSKVGLEILLITLLISSILIIIGKFYKPAIITFFLGFSYFFLLDKAYYNNHLYLIALIAFLLIFIPADGNLSLNKKQQKPILNWHIKLLQAQFVIVYFFGGLAKVNSDWLIHLEPISTLLKVNEIYSYPLAIFLSYSGLLFDLLIGFLLLNKLSRPFAAIGVVIFNISNHFLFDDINIFPFFMLASLIIFFDLSKFKFPFSNLTNKQLSNTKVKPVLLFISVYLFIQILLPLRHYLIPENVDWTGEGQRFAWRMKIQTRSINTLEFAIFDLDTKKIYPVDIQKHIHSKQIEQMSYYPKMVLDYSHFLGNDAIKNYKLKNIMVKTNFKIDFNQRKNIPICSPEIDLFSERWSHFIHNHWITNLQ